MNSTTSGLAAPYQYVETKDETMTHIARYFVRLVLAICKEVEPLYTNKDTMPVNIAGVAFEAFNAAYESGHSTPVSDADVEMARIVHSYVQLLGVGYAEPICNEWDNEDTTRTYCEIEFLWPVLDTLLVEKFGYQLPTLYRIIIDATDIAKPWTFSAADKHHIRVDLPLVELLDSDDLEDYRQIIDTACADLHVTLSMSHPNIMGE